MPHLNLKFFPHQYQVSALILGHWMDKVALMSGGEKICLRKPHDASENHREKYFEESFCAKHLSNFFLMIAMCQKVLDRHGISLGCVKNFDGCEMACGEGARQV